MNEGTKGADARVSAPAACGAAAASARTDAASAQMQAAAEECADRAVVYRLIARLFDREVDAAAAEAIEGIARDGADAARAAGGGSDAAESGDAAARMAQAAMRMARGATPFDARTQDALACDFARTFLAVGARTGNAAAPYESVFTSETGLMMQEARDEVRTTYRAHGLMPRIDGDQTDFPEDYLPLELEFMALLSLRLGDELACGNAADARRTLDDQRAFYTAHLVNWYGDFSQRARGTARTPFYAGLLDFAGAYLELDAETMDAIDRCLADAA